MLNALQRQILGYAHIYHKASLVTQRERACLPVQETPEVWVRFLGQEDSPEEGMTTHSSIVAWRIPWTEGSGGLQSTGLQSWTGLSDGAHPHTLPQ